MDRLLLRPTEAAQRLGISRSTLYRLIADQQIVAVHIGSSCRISVQALEEYVARLQREARRAAL
jgi:excisionase family DNA binding protein